MESVGSQLRQARSRLGLTLEQVSARTRICTKNLQAIEDDDLSQISSPFFYRSFVRQFAEQVRLDYAALAPAVQSAAATMPEPLIPGQTVAGPNEPNHPKVPALRIHHRRSLKWLSSFVWLGVMVVGFSGFYALWQNARPHTAAAPPAVRPSPSRAQTAQKPLAPSVDPPFRIELSALERTWLSIMADGRQIFSGVLETAETKVLEGHDNARIRTGNAGGISLVFNGKPIGTLGRRGQVRTVVFTKNNYEVLQSPVHVALAQIVADGE